jgi:protein O-GlcNAcase / histone acetyltransferase
VTTRAVRCPCRGHSKDVCLGPKVISRRLTVSHLNSVNSVLCRRVTIWDNLNANDYDQRRLYLGPFSGRSSNLSSRLSGLLINPNCEFEVNFIPLNTLGQWFQSVVSLQTADQIDDNRREQTTDLYQSERALDRAIVEWSPEFNRSKSAVGGRIIGKVSCTCSSCTRLVSLMSRSNIRRRR